MPIATQIEAYKQDVLQRASKRVARKKPEERPEFYTILPYLDKLVGALGSISAKELPAPNINVNPSEVAVNVESPDVSVTVEGPKQSKIENIIELYDYTEAFKALTVRIEELIAAVNNRPLTWEVTRNNRGFIERIDGSNQ